ncbi:fibronectin type III domain-containing protein [Hymenobacter rubidus]|uniref:fibronectin type III domain-containing protein n=1 Tax=Hymenobacter rubidus TaxID=1441626 RepID=UPI00191DF6D0|nr:fibronectin type III domain-containing protein [Hymenobacter rubidus]
MASQAQTANCVTGLGGFCGGNDISAVSISGTTLNATGLTCTTAGSQAYTAYPATGSNTGTLSSGVPYTLSVTLTGASIVSMWIDYNHNFIYEASEWTQVTTNSAMGTPVSVAFQVPAGAVQGTTGLRIRSRATLNNNGATDACTSFGSGETKDFTVTIGAPAACPAVTALTVTGITATGAVVGFTPAAGSTSYTVTVTPTGGTATTQTVTGSPITLTGLAPSTSYTVSIVGSCSASSTSAPNTITFITSCVTAPYATVNNTTPYTQDFETAWLSQCGTNEAPGLNWRNTPVTGNTSWRRDDDGPSAAWSSTGGSYTPAGSPLSGTSLHSARFHSYDVASRGRGSLDLYVNMAGTTGAPTLNFDYINTSGSDSLKVFVSTNGGTTFTAQPLASLGVIGTWTRQTVNLPTTGLTATTIVRLRAVGDFGGSDIGLDNVRVSYVSCPAITGLTATGVTGSGAVLTFTPATGVTNYTVTITPAGGTATTQTATGSPITLTGLTPSTAYTVSIVGNCGTSSTSVATITTFTTACASAPYATVNNTTPYTQDFETTWLSLCGTTEAPAVNWRNTPVTGNPSWRRDDDGAAAAWTSPSSGAYTPAGSPLGSTSLHSARFHSYFAANRAVGTLDLYVNMSGTSGTPTLAFDYINVDGTDSLAVYVSTNGGTTFSAQPLAAFGLASTWTRQSVNLPATGLTATTVVRLRAIADFGNSDIGVDNVRVAYVLCPAVTGLTATGLTPTAASINFTLVSATSYTVTITPAGGTATTQTVTASPLNLTALTPNTAYTVSIVTNCSGSQTSQPAVLTFSTPPVPPANDDCAGALTVPVQFGTCTVQTSANNTAATTSTGPTPSCNTNVQRDVWFKVTVPASGIVTISTVAPTGGSNITDTVMGVYSGTCSALTEVGCNDDTNGLYSQVALTGRTPGEILYIRVWSYNAATTGPVAVCVISPSNCAPPSGPTATNVTNTTASLNWVAPTGSTGNTYEIEYGPQGFTQGTGTVLTGLPATTTTVTGLTPSTAYCFYVRQNCGATNGSSAYVGPTCFTTPLTAPANDEPCGAITLSAAAISGTNVGATTSVQPGINLPVCSPAARPNDVWYAFTPTTTAITFTCTGTAAAMVRVYTSPSCSAGPFVLVRCVGLANNTSVGTFTVANLVANTRYYVAVSGYGSTDASGTFTIGATSVLATRAQADTNALLVYPNPSSTGQLTLKLSGLSGAGQATLLNALGQTVLTKPLAAGSTEQLLATRGLAAGLYTLRVTVAGQVLTRKVVLE